MPALIERILSTLPGWLFLASGLALLAMVVLTEPWQEQDRLQWERDILASQAQRLADQREKHAVFLQAVRQSDPVVLERLAMAELRLKRQGTALLQPAPPASALSEVDDRLALSATAPVEAWLKPASMDDPVPPYRPSDRMVFRLTEGPRRQAVLGVAGLCLLAGIWFRGPRQAS